MLKSGCRNLRRDFGKKHTATWTLDLKDKYGTDSEYLGNFVTVNEIVSIRESIGTLSPKIYGDTTLEET